MIEVCSQYYIKDKYQQFFFIECIESNDKKSNYEEILDQCANQVGTEMAPEIKSCWNGDNARLGNYLMHLVADQTDSLNPRHTYVPWVVGQGTHNDTVQNEVTASLWNYVCDNYTGSDKSTDCDAASKAFPEVLLSDATLVQ